MTSRGRDRQTSLERAADRIRQLGLQLPVASLLEAGRPLALIGAQLMWIAQPALGLVLPRRDVAEAAELLEDPASVSALIDLLGREPGDVGGGQ